MELLFGGLLLGCLAFLVRIVLEYSSQASVWNDKVRQAEVQMAAAENQVQEFVKGKEEALARIQAVEVEMQALENMKNDLKNRIDEMKKQHAKKGKVILHRQAPQEG